MNSPAILPALPAELTPVPEGYDYVGMGPIFPRRDDGGTPFDQPTGHLAASAHPEIGWGVDGPLRGDSTTLHYAAKRGTEVHRQLLPHLNPAPEPEPEPELVTAVPRPEPAVTTPRAMPADLPPLPEGYDYVGMGPLFPPRADGRAVWGQDPGHLASYNRHYTEWVYWHTLNGNSPNLHYAALRGTEVHWQLLPHLNPAPEPRTLEQEPFTPTPIPTPTMDTDTDTEEDEAPEGYTRLEDGRIVRTYCLVEVVTSGHCENHSSQSGRYYGRSTDFETTMLPEDDEGVTWLENENCFALDGSCDQLRSTESGDKAFEANCTRIHGCWYHNDMVSYDGHGDPFYSEDDDYVYCQGEGETYHRNECHYCEHEGEWVHGEADECACSNTEESDDHINEYHHSPAPERYFGPHYSGWGVGFEVEKTDIYGVEDGGAYVGSSPLFAGWERDASCGVEGITHVYDPLSADDIFRDHVERSRRYLNAASDKTCGGHINISHTGLQPRSLLQRLRTYAPLWYAIYRNRLNNSYCIEDKKVEHGTVKYSPLRTKDFGVELRLPSGVRNAEQLVRRFELIANVCRAIDAGWSLNRYAKECRQLLLHGAYEGNRTKYANILRLTRHFDRWFKDGHIHADIAQYV